MLTSDVERFVDAADDVGRPTTYRAAELSRLVAHLGHAHVSTSFVHVTGAADCGKTTLVRQLVANVDTPRVLARYVDCHDAFADEKTFYRHVLATIDADVVDVVYVQQFVNTVVRVVDGREGECARYCRGTVGVL